MDRRITLAFWLVSAAAVEHHSCDCSYPKVPASKWSDGSVLDVRRSVNASQVDAAFERVLHSQESNHTDGRIVNRPRWVPVLTIQVSYSYAQQRIAPLPCNPTARGEDSVLFRTFFFTPEGLPLLGEGTFVETGANDGFTDSTTLFFEKCLGWRGALIEPHPVFWTRLLRTPRAHSTKRQAAVCARNGTAVIERKPWMGSTIRTAGEEVGLEVPCAPLSELLGSVHALSHAGRVDVLSLDVEGHEPIAVSTLGNELSYGVVMAEVEVGPRRVDTMKTLLARGMHYAGQISARPSPANYVISDVWWNRSHFERFWPRSRVLSL